MDVVETPSGITVPSEVGPELEFHLEMELDYDPHVNLAMHQNSVPVVKAVRITNLGESDVEDLELDVSAEPGLAAPVQALVSRISAGGTHRLDSLEPQFSVARLVNQREREKGEIVVRASVGGTECFRRAWPLELLAYNEWAGSSSLPEILASFVLPNHPAVENLLVSARQILGRRTGDESLSGYQQRDRRRVFETMRAVYDAACDLGLSYVNPPASFETSGQKIRTPDQILDLRMGTCLDLVVFLAAALEQVGLHPVVLLPEGHAFLGCWLEEETFVDAAIDDAARIRKRVALGQIEVIETTCVTHRPATGFEEAVRKGRQHLDEPERFRFAVDIRTARREQIRPLPLRVRGDEYAIVPVAAPIAKAERAGDPGGPAREPRPAGADAEAEETGRDRIERWKRKLLDLSLRNRFLNFKETRNAVPLLCPDVFRLEDFLAAGRPFALQPRPKMMSEEDPRDPGFHQKTTGEDALEEYLRDQLDQGQVHATLPPGELENRLIHLSREAKLHEDEGGANTLYLAIGFLHWFESESSEERRTAPILLLPLTLTRDVVQSAFRFQLADEEARANVTLLQKLESDFQIRIPGMKELDTDESGVDVKAILDRVRTAVLTFRKWDVTEEAVIGHFSFNKFLMWRDLEMNAAKLLDNPVVRHLVEKPTEEFEPGATFPDPGNLDEKTHPADVFCPLDADSTQLSAIHAAADGRTFVLEGPPGTGKSQTITNLISHVLATGKRVLFVSEKMAALNVVRKRLENVGLGPFCLEIHSNKAQKRAVLDQLRDALEFQARADSEGWGDCADNLLRVRKELNGYATALNEPRTFGRSARDGIARLVRYRDVPHVGLDFGDPKQIDRKRFESLGEVVRELEVVLEEMEDPGSHPYRGARLTEWSPARQEQVGNRAAAMGPLTERLEAPARELAALLDVPGDSLSHVRIEGLIGVATDLTASPALPEAFLLESDWERVERQVQEWVGVGREHLHLDEILAKRYRPELDSLDLIDVRRALTAAAAARWPFSWLKGRRAVQALKEASIDGRLPKGAELLSDVDRAIRRRQLRDRLAQADGAARVLVGHRWRREATDWEELAAVAKWTGELHGRIRGLAEADLDARRRIREACARLATEGRDLFGAGGSARRWRDEAQEALARVVECRDALVRLLLLPEDDELLDSRRPGFGGHLRDRCRRWSEQLPQLRGWCAYRRVWDRAREAGLDPLLRAVDGGGVRRDQLRPAFEHSFYRWWVNRIFDEEPVLRRFNGAGQEARIRRFRNLEKTIAEDTPGRIQGRLRERIPQGGGAVAASGTSEMGILHRELMKQRCHKPIRQLLQMIPNVVSRLKPCFLMSPLSVAQYLDFDFPDFDLVVFDEASQIPVWDSIGAIRRGANLIVVGDSKQLPPTNFFQRAEEGEEVFEDEIIEMESILDECIAARLPRLHLGWHYRSRHESLIAFSNHHYYENRLLTFPSPTRDPRKLGLSWHLVEGGTYDRGRSRANAAEAEAIVEEIVGRLTDPERRHESLGVVTFSQAQQSRLEDLLDRARREHPEVDRFFTSEVAEPVFVKNLENVQGDERDVILFSVCYGPDRDGRIALNFGPLNRAGGERRLNVAVTRARKQVLLYSSLTADQIDLARTKAVGVSHLKAYLEYAQKGEEALGRELGIFGDAEAESPFEEEVIRTLVEAGLEVVPQVGCSGYRIDIGVKDSERPGRFLLGVECDGAMYHSGKTARDRDRLRAAVLSSLGWRLHRIWSTDWWQDPERETQKLLAAIDDARRSIESEVRAPEAGGNGADEAEGGSEEPDSVYSPSELFANASHQAVEVRESPQSPARTGVTPGDLGGRPYPSLPPHSGGTAEQFYGGSATGKIREIARTVIEAEAPIAFTRLARIVAGSFDLQRVTSRVRERMQEVLSGAPIVKSRSANDVFIWLQSQGPESLDGFRYHEADDPNRRGAEEIPPREAANAAEAVLRRHVSMSATDLCRETARLFGFKGLGRKVAECIQEGIDLLVSEKRVSRNGEIVTSF